MRHHLHRRGQQDLQDQRDLQVREDLRDQQGLRGQQGRQDRQDRQGKLFAAARQWRLILVVGVSDMAGNGLYALAVRAGPRFEGPRSAGLSHLVEHMLFRGTRRHPCSRDFHEAIETIDQAIAKDADAYYQKQRAKFEAAASGS